LRFRDFAIFDFAKNFFFASRSIAPPDIADYSLRVCACDGFDCLL